MNNIQTSLIISTIAQVFYFLEKIRKNELIVNVGEHRPDKNDIVVAKSTIKMNLLPAT